VRPLRSILIILGLLLVVLPSAASASAGQESTFQDDNLLLFRGAETTTRTLDTLRGLGVDRVRVSVFWPTPPRPGSPTTA